MKKIASIVLALILVLAMAAPAMATKVAPATYTITVNGKSGHIYEVYQIFTGDLYEGILSNIAWGTGVSETGRTAMGDAEAKADSLTTENNVKAFADAVEKYLQAPTQMTAGTAAADGSVAYTLSGLVAGYYLIKDKDGSQEVEDGTYTAYMLKVVQDVTATPKDSVPTVDKSVNGEGNNAADVNIGDTVTFTLKATLGTNIAEFEKYKVVFNDTLSAGLTFKEYVSATLDNKDVKANFVQGGTGTKLTFSCDDVKALGAVDGSVIIITYTATLNSNAEIGKPGNKNEVYLEYSNDPSHSGEGENNPTGDTPKDEVLVFTYELDVTKVDDKDAETKLEGAEFVLYRNIEIENTETEEEGDKKIVPEYAKVDGNGKITGWTQVESEASTLTSDANGLFKVIGLDAGIYYLEETKAPNGYNLLEKPVKVEIVAALNTDEDAAALESLQIKVDDGDAVDGVKDTGIVSTSIQNNKGATLPSTGGMGTTIFYIVGGLLIAGAAIALITKKRMASK